MEIFRKIILGLSCAAFAVCCLFLNLMGGIGLMSNNYTDIGRALIISVVLLGLSLLLAFFRNRITNLGSALLNIAGTVFYIVLNGIPNATVPKESIEVLTSRIYPAIIVTVLLAIAVFADIFSYERSVKRAERKNAKLKEKNRSLKEDEKIV